ncbi:acyltransferase [Streptomyces sp. NBC_01217]|uniref:acyltransferase n=1 Tax=Streptomyces sp. NBC_01217 TaxID=2903779 RepID=UPI002E151B23|nr:N-acetyltransferase [Streptomyces sp. NBC_01217]
MRPVWRSTQSCAASCSSRGPDSASQFGVKARCVVGRGAYVGTGVRIGNNVKLQNYALVYEPAELGDGVFVGPAVVLTNGHNPRSVDSDGRQKRGGDWEAVGVKVAEGASLGARSVCVAPVRAGRWAMVAAGAVVTKDVLDFALAVGVPARQIGWVGRSGVRLVAREGEPDVWECPQTGALYEEKDGVLTERRAGPHSCPAALCGQTGSGRGRGPVMNRALAPAHGRGL